MIFYQQYILCMIIELYVNVFDSIIIIQNLSKNIDISLNCNELVQLCIHTNATILFCKL
jgi:hypothetical protein